MTGIHMPSRRIFIDRSVKGAGVAVLASKAPFVLAERKSKSRKIGIALVGLGYYSTDVLAPAFRYTHHCELRGIVTGSPSKIPMWQMRYGIKDKNIYSYETMHAIANNPDIDVVYIVLPTFLHKKYSLIGANAGKHVWCEKPMAMNVTECQAIIDACNKNKVKLSIGYRMQHEPNTQMVMQYARSKSYGDVKKVISEAGYGGGGFAPENWKMHTSKGGGAMYDMGVYAINGARYGTALEPVAVSATYVNPEPQKFMHTDPETKFTLEFPEDILATCKTSTINFVNRLRVDCEKGWYELQPMQTYSGVVGRTSDGKKLNQTIVNQQATQMDNDSLAILRNTDVLVSGEEGLKDIRVVTAAHQSAQNGSKRIALQAS